MGGADNILLFVEHLREGFPKMLSTEGEFQDQLQKIFWHLHKKYNLDARQYRGQNTNPFPMWD